MLILEEQTSTVVIEPGWKVRVDGTGNLTLRNQSRTREVVQN
jgi:N-methylhydantoinase A/oxoprolinase/acetone carboxylase beta subunit